MKADVAPPRPSADQRGIDQGDKLMANPEKTIEVPTAQPQKETMLDKTTRVVRQINDEDAHKRYEKSAKLRKARLKKRRIDLLKPSGQNLAERGVGVDPLNWHAIGDFTI
jgi:hypothetical protein